MSYRGPVADAPDSDGLVRDGLRLEDKVYGTNLSKKVLDQRMLEAGINTTIERGKNAVLYTLAGAIVGGVVAAIM